MTQSRRAHALLGLALLAVPSPAGGPVSPTAAELVRDLGSPRFAERDRASRALWEMGAPAVAALRAARTSPDPEVAQRAADILGRFEAGIFPDTPPDVLKLIREFRGGGPDEQRFAAAGLVRAGPRGHAALRALLVLGTPAETRGPLFEHIAAVLRHEVPRALVAGRTDVAEDLLSLNALGPSDAGLADYAIFLALRKRTAAAVADLEAAQRAGGPAGDAAAKALVFVHRAAGDTARAKAAAAALASADPTARPMYDSLLEDLGAWSELADRSAAGLGSANSRDGLTLFRLRQAGRTAEADALAERQLDADVGDRGRFGAVDEPTMALMLGGRPLAGIDRMAAKRNLPHILADTLAARLRFREALHLIGADAARAADEASGYDTAALRHLYGTRRGRLLAQLGERDAAAQVFNQLADQLGGGRDDYSLTQLLRAEVRAGRHDLACEHAGRLLVAGDPDGERKFGAGRLDPFEALFEQDAEAGQFWWRTLRPAAGPGETPGATMRLVRALLTGQASAADFERVVRAASQDHLPPTADTADGFARVLGLAAVYRAAGKTDDAIAALADAADGLAGRPADVTPTGASGRGSRAWVFGTDERFRLWLELGDLLTDAGRHADAARRFEEGWNRHPDAPVLLYLSGRALAKAGDADGAKRRIELSHWVGLGNARVRGRFLEELVARGHAADARRERDLITEAGWRSELYLGNVWNQVARASAVLKEFAPAAAANRRAVHYLLRTPGVYYVEGYAYLTVPQAARVFEARGLLAAGKPDDALSAAADCLAVLPGNIDVPLGLVPGLDRLGRTKDADALFRRVWGEYTTLAAEHPGSAWARYTAAWLAAGCRRELDSALAHAKKAVESEPESKTYREGLAEVHFRRGDRAEAVALMAKLAASDPRNHHYRRQLERYRADRFDSPLPDLED